MEAVERASEFVSNFAFPNPKASTDPNWMARHQETSSHHFSDAIPRSRPPSLHLGDPLGRRLHNPRSTNFILLQAMKSIEKRSLRGRNRQQTPPQGPTPPNVFPSPAALQNRQGTHTTPHAKPDDEEDNLSSDEFEITGIVSIRKSGTEEFVTVNWKPSEVPTSSLSPASLKLLADFKAGNSAE
jgi:hypothetical protein